MFGRKIKNAKIQELLLKERAQVEKECREYYKLEKKLSDENHYEEQQRKIDETIEFYNTKIKENEIKYNESMQQIIDELQYVKKQNKNMQEEYKQAKIDIDNIDMVIRRVNNMLNEFNNKINLQIAQFRQPFLIVQDDIEKCISKLDKTKRKELDND